MTQQESLPATRAKATKAVAGATKVLLARMVVDAACGRYLRSAFAGLELYSLIADLADANKRGRGHRAIIERARRALRVG